MEGGLCPDASPLRVANIVENIMPQPRSRYRWLLIRRQGAPGWCDTAPGAAWAASAQPASPLPLRCLRRKRQLGPRGYIAEDNSGE